MKYKHNDYYGYINKIQEKAISNPQWFWSNSEDALQARTWLRNNGAQSIIDDIYNNTPEEMRMSIPSTMLSKEQREGRVLDYQREHTNKAAEKVFEGGIALAGAPALISSFAAAPIATTYGLIGGHFGTKWGSKIGSKIGNNIITTDTVNNGYGSIIHTNRDSGSKIGGLIGGATVGTVYGSLGNSIEKQLLSKYGYNGGVSFKDMLYELKHKGEGVLPGEYEGWYHPAERYSSQQRTLDRAEWTKWLDNIQKYKDTYQKYTTHSEGFKLIEPDIELRSALKPNSIKAMPIYKAGPYTENIHNFINAAEKANEYWKSQGSFTLNPETNNASNAETSLIHWVTQRPRIILDEMKTTGDSYSSYNRAVIGTNINEQFPVPIEVIGHELGHRNPLFNTRAITDSLTDNQKNTLISESPYYNMDYSGLTSRIKSLLKAIEGINKHDFEYSEGYSDLFGMKTNMNNLGLGKNGKYTMLDLLRYKYTTPYGKTQRFLKQRPGLRRQLNALNESENWK